MMLLNLTPETLKRLADAGLDPAKLPRHIAVIMDGNGRWAQERGKQRIHGHLQGVTSVRRTIEECCRLGIGQLTLYCFSTENWKRPQEEIDFLMTLLKEYLIKERAEIMQQNIRFTVIGRRDQLPDFVLAEMDENIRVSSGNTGMVLCLAINYSGRTEIVDAVRTLAERGACRQIATRRHRRANDHRRALHGRHARSRSADPHRGGDAD